MAEGFAAATANAILNALCRNTSWTQPATLYAKLHTGAPGAAGTANAATETRRVQATFGSAASGGAISNTAALEWTSVAGAEDYTHVTLWDASTAGNFICSGTIGANAMQVSDTLTIPIGDLDIALPTAS